MGGFEGNHFSIEYPNAHSELKGSASWKLGYFLREIGKNKKIIIHSLTKIQKYVYLDGAIKVHKFFEQCFFSQFEMVNVVHIFNFTRFFYGSHWLFINCQMAKQTKLTTHTRIYKRKKKGWEVEIAKKWHCHFLKKLQFCVTSLLGK